MKTIKYEFDKRDFLYGGIITATIAVIAFLLAIIGLSIEVFDPIGQAFDNFHLSDGFFYTQAKGHPSTMNTNPDIVIVDIQDCDSREEIADIVNRINQAGPQALVVDIIFSNYASASSREDSVLTAAFRQTENLILAQRNVYGEDGWQTERSFFADEFTCREGDVGFSPGMVRSFERSINVDGKDVPTFVSLIANECGLEVPSGKLLINYCPVTTITLSADNVGCEELLKGRVVIIGDLNDRRDYHNIPVLMDGQTRTSGIKIIAQEYYTLLPHNRFYTSPEWVSIIFGILMTYLFCTFIASPMSRKKRFNGLWIKIWQVVVLIVLLILTYWSFWGFHLYMPLNYWLVGVGFSELATEIFYFVKSLKS